MKRIYILLFFILPFLTLQPYKTVAQKYEVYLDSVFMGKNYNDQLYFNFEDKIVKRVQDPDWDIAFQLIKFEINSNLADPKGASILTNTAHGVDLYTIPTTNNFQLADSAGLYANRNGAWKKMYNSDTSFNKGAFNAHKSVHPFDFGWGDYGFFLNNHNVVGDSVFLIKTRSGAYKKLFIDSLKSGVWYFKFSNLDNSDLKRLSINKSTFDTLATFAYCNLETGEIKSIEPSMKSWDLLFSKYTFTENRINKKCVSILGNEIAGTMCGVDPNNSFANSTSPNNYDDNINMIGNSWNTCNLDDTITNCQINTSLVYYVKAQNQKEYKLQILSTDKSTGKIVFVHQQMDGMVGINQLSKATINLYPNPSNGVLTIQNSTTSSGSLSIFDLNGKVITQQFIPAQTNLKIDLSNQNKGIYLARLVTTEGVQSGKITIQ